MSPKAISTSVLGLAVVASFAGSASAATVFAAGGDATTGSIQSVVDGFRNAVGNPNHGNGGGPFTLGRREINWEGAAIPADPGHMPGNFFNNNALRGAVFETPGAGFFVSQRNPGNPADPNLRYGSINASYNSEFGAFSGQRLFIADGSTVTDVLFRVPISPTSKATVNGFGVVFTDVDQGSTSWMEFYGAGDALLAKEFVPAGTVGEGSFSFLGVVFDVERVERVRIVSGNTAAGAGIDDGVLLDTGLTTDVVAMDDFIYGEPVPGPSVGALAGIGLMLAGTRRRR
ncbi:MAG: hypothetical protein IT435_03420 [Phycisphaerales bacterium]|nr:hypothetical protein [Phycisphaerales bacterium]